MTRSVASANQSENVDPRDGLARFSQTLQRGFVTEIQPGRLNVLAILDEFSTPAFASVCNLFQADPLNPTADLDVIDFDFILVESVWRGNGGRWPFLTKQVADGAPLAILLEECRRRSIPTVFWNKEDPPHFDRFIQVAAKFDYVFTSDAAMIDSYRKTLGHDRIQLLRFAAAQDIHNPARVAGYREGDVAFAGQYFSHKYPERREQMNVLFPVAAEHKFSIFSRILSGDSRYAFPAPYDSYVVGSLPYAEMVREYRRHKVFLNVNSVVSSQTMCARRVFELSAAKTAVLGTESAAVRSVFDSSEIPLVSNTDEATDLLDRLVRDDAFRRQTVQRAWRKTLAGHTYDHRLREMTHALGISRPAEPLSISVLIRSHGKEQTEALAVEMKNQQFSMPVECVTTLLEDRGSVEVFPASRTSPVENSILAVVDDRFTYGQHYISDLVLAMQQQGADACAKTLSDSMTTDPEEEQFIQGLPEHGGIVRGQVEWLAEQYLVDDVRDALAQYASTQRTYASDVLDVDIRGRNRD